MLMFLILIQQIHSYKTDAYMSTGGVIGWGKLLATAHKNSIKVLGYSSSKKNLNFDPLLSEMIKHKLYDVNLTRSINNALGKFALVEEPEHVSTLPEPLNEKKTGNILKFEDLIGKTVDLDKYGIKVSTANDVIGSFVGFINSSISIAVIWAIATLFFIFQFIGCCFIWKARTHRQPKILLKIALFLVLVILVISAIFFLLAFSGLEFFVEPYKVLETQILKDISNQLYGGLEATFYPGDSGSQVYQMFNPMFTNISENITNLKTIIDKIDGSITEHFNNINESVFKSVMKDFNDNIDSLNNAIDDAHTNYGANISKLEKIQDEVISGIYSNIKESKDKISDYTKKIDSKKNMIDGVSEQLKNISDELKDMSGNWLDDILEELDEMRKKTSRTKYDNALGKIIDQIIDYYKTWQTIYIIIGALIIVTVVIYGSCFCSHCAVARCCSSSSAICPFIFNIVLVVIAFVTTIPGCALCKIGEIYKDSIDTATSVAIDQVAPNGQIDIPPISFDSITDNLISGTVKLELKVNKDKIKVLNAFRNLFGQYKHPLSSIINTYETFKFGELGNDASKQLYDISNEYSLPNEIEQEFNESYKQINEYEDQVKEGLAFYHKINQSYDDKLDALKSKDNYYNSNKDKIDDINETFRRLEDTYKTFYVSFEKPGEFLTNNYNEFQDDIRYIIRNIANNLLDYLPKTNEVLDKINVSNIIYYYPQLENAVSYSIPYFASSFSLASHLFIFGSIFLVLIMWYQRQFQLNVTHAESSSYYYSSSLSMSKSSAKSNSGSGKHEYSSSSSSSIEIHEASSEKNAFNSYSEENSTKENQESAQSDNNQNEPSSINNQIEENSDKGSESLYSNESSGF